MSQDINKDKALAAALGQIEKQFGKGSIMRLGDGAAAMMEIEAVFHWLIRSGCGTRYRRSAIRPCRGNLRSGKLG